MKRSKIFWWLMVIFLLAVVVRFYAFSESIYFGFDEARDAYISTDIFTKGDLKLIGPPTTGDIGLFHGPLYWYLLGPIYILSGNNPEVVSALFRLINASGVFMMFMIASSLFNPFTGLLASFLYAISYEQSQYAMYVGNPALGVLTTLAIFVGAVLIYKKRGKINLGLPFMFMGGAIATQLNLMFGYFFLTVGGLLFILKKKIKLIPKKSWLVAILLSLFILSTYILAEFKYSFRTIKLAISLIFGDYDIISAGSSKYQVFFDKFLMMYHDNFLGLIENRTVLTVIAFGFSSLIIYKSIKDIRFRMLVLWVFSWVFLMILGGHMAYYTNVGNSLGITIAVAVFLGNLKKRNYLLFGLILIMIMAGNLFKIWHQSPQSLISDIKPQPGMKLADEKRIIDMMYKEANGQGFTIRLTGIPYKIQTVWSYLFDYYGLKKYGYLPYWENGNISAFPGSLPVPKEGVSCVRFLVREPMRGLPVELVESDIKEENLFSVTKSRLEIGNFVIETRQALDEDCHNLKAM